MGRAGPFPRVVFREEVMQALDRYSHLHSAGEQGGFLIGRKQDLKSAEQYEILVERFVPIPQRSGASRLVITAEHYASVQSALERAGRGEQIVGWAHTHPGFGVFLSHFDREQHERFFPEPWQIAYVMDHQTPERALYHVLAGEWKRLPGYYVLRDMAANEIGIASPGGSSRWLKAVLAVLVVGLLVVGGTYGYSLVRELYFNPAVTQMAADEPVEPPSPPEEEQVQEEAAVQEQPPAQPVPAQTSLTPPSTIPRYTEYVVERGDNLWTIAQKLWGDPSLYRVIAEENGITNPSMISVGTVLKVPVEPRSNE
ncbi:MAG: LysM peptidoglycan-binding domain-containing protein [Firmicutes bacterium]|nr:LysM peptidoglycan-binding domain-containing protein [Bacillota bacterium]